MSIRGHKDVSAIAFFPDGNKCITGADDLRVWDIKTGECTMTLLGHHYSIRAIAVTPDGKKCISSYEDCTLLIWDLKTHCQVKELNKLDVIKYLFVSPDGETCICGSSASIYLLNLKTYEMNRIVVLPASLVGVNFSLSDIQTELKETLRQNGAIVS